MSESEGPEGTPPILHDPSRELTAREQELAAIYERVPGILFYVRIEAGGEFRFLSMSSVGLGGHRPHPRTPRGRARERRDSAALLRGGIEPLPRCNPIGPDGALEGSVGLSLRTEARRGDRKSVV